MSILNLTFHQELVILLVRCYIVFFWCQLTRRVFKLFTANKSWKPNPHKYLFKVRVIGFRIKVYYTKIYVILTYCIVQDDTDTIITCTTENESRRDKFSYTWEKNNELIQAKHTNEIIEPLETYGSLLRIIKAESSANYSCIVANSAGKTPKNSKYLLYTCTCVLIIIKINNYSFLASGESISHVHVHVLESRGSPACRPEYDEFKLGWELTGPGQIAKRRCPMGYAGFVQRKCQPVYVDGKITRAKWGSSDFSRCLSNQLKSINKTVSLAP